MNDILTEKKITENDIDRYYSIWPDIDHLSIDWKSLGIQVYRRILSENLAVFFTGRKWVVPSEAFFVLNETFSSEEYSVIIEECLLGENISVVKNPAKHVVEGIQEVTSVNKVTPKLVQFLQTKL